MSTDVWNRACQTWMCARRSLGGHISAVEFGAAESAVVSGDGAEPARVIPFQLGLSDLSSRYFGATHPIEAAIEAAITEVEDRVMPLRSLLVPGTRCVTHDRHVRAVAELCGPTAGSRVTLSTDAVEHLFNRWVAIALGRPATQDVLPISGEFAASLLILREWLHHLNLAEITVFIADTAHQEDDGRTLA